MSVLAIVLFVASLVGAILVHELGHLVTAKSFGMRADRYFVGFGPTLWSRRRGETEYGLKAFPLGGFVSIRGMSPLDERLPPVVDAVLDPRRLAADRLAAAEDHGGDPAREPTCPAPTFTRLSEELTVRGAPPAMVDDVVARVRAGLRDDTSVAEARQVLAAALTTVVGPSRRLGDLAWRIHEGDRSRFYGDRPRWQRAMTIATGPATHVVMAFAVLVVAYVFVPLPTGESTTVVAQTLPDSPAAEAGLQPGDVVTAVDGRSSSDYEVLRLAIRERPGVPTTLGVLRDGQPLEIELVPRREVDETSGEAYGLAGFLPEPVTAPATVAEAVTRAAVGDEVVPIGGVWPMLTASVEGMARIFSPEGIGSLVSQATGAEERDAEGAMSVVGIASLAGQVATGPTAILTLALLFAALNMFLFLFNLVPLPPFDGGHLAVLAVERVGNTLRALRGRTTDFTVDPRAITAVAVPVIGVLLVVFLATLWLDITSPLNLG